MARIPRAHGLLTKALVICGRCERVPIAANYLGHSQCPKHGWSPKFVRAPVGRTLCSGCRGRGCGQCGQTGLEVEPPETPTETAPGSRWTSRKRP